MFRMRSYFLVFGLVLLCAVVPLSSVAQPGNPAGDPDVPITGIEFLLGMGGILGAKKIRDSIRKKE